MMKNGTKYNKRLVLFDCYHPLAAQVRRVNTKYRQVRNFHSHFALGEERGVTDGGNRDIPEANFMNLTYAS
jgi:hypothetical protein